MPLPRRALDCFLDLVACHRVDVGDFAAEAAMIDDAHVSASGSLRPTEAFGSWTIWGTVRLTIKARRAAIRPPCRQPATLSTSAIVFLRKSSAMRFGSISDFP